MDVIPLWQGVCMVVGTARRVREGLAELIRLVNDPATPAGDLRVVLGECKAFGGQLAVLQADTAGGLATRERHGDGGVGALAQAAGLPRREAAGHVRTVKQLQGLPSVRDAVENGDISVANARVLAATSDKTDAEQVQQDAELLAQAAVLSPEQFAREAGRWAARRQPDDAEERYRRQRARRRLGIWNGDDGMMHLRGELDPVTGAKVRKRFLLEAERLRRLDLRSPRDNKRTLDQRMADALDTLTSHGSIYAKTATTPNEPHDDNSNTKAAGTPNGSHEGRSGGGHVNGSAAGANEDRSGHVNGSAAGANEDRSGHVNGSAAGANEDRSGHVNGSAAGANEDRSGHVNGSAAGANEDRSGHVNGSAAGANEDRSGHVNGSAAGVGDSRSGMAGNRCGCGGRPSADITIVQHLSADGTEAFAEIAGGEVIPQSVLEEHFCNARIKGVVFSSEGVPLWHGHSKRVATKAQTNALRARYGACGGCGADMWICQGHHVQAVSQGGPTNIDNMMLLCWGCHQKVHLHSWREAPDGRGLYTIKPPERTHHGPAHAPDPAPDHGPGPPRRNRQPKPPSTDKPETDPINPAAPPQPETLFTPA